MDQGWHPTPSMSGQMLLKELHMHPTKLNIASGISHALDGVQGNFQTGCMISCHAQKTEPYGQLFLVGKTVCQRPQLLLQEMDFSLCLTMMSLAFKEYLDFLSGYLIQEQHQVAPAILHFLHLCQTMYLSNAFELQMVSMPKFKELLHFAPGEMNALRFLRRDPTRSNEWRSSPSSCTPLVLGT